VEVVRGSWAFKPSYDGYRWLAERIDFELEASEARIQQRETDFGTTTDEGDMKNEARDKAIQVISKEWELGYTAEGPMELAYAAGYQAARDKEIIDRLGEIGYYNITVESVRKALGKAYQAGYQAARDNAIRILSSNKENSYESA
jgi:hypothetical protein